MIVLIDNYDSFAWNLARYFELATGKPCRIFRNDAVSLDEIGALNPEAIVISPGPCAPAQAGISRDVIARFAGAVPMLGVCLGHQCIAEAFGGEVVPAQRPMHGRASLIMHDHDSLFAGLPAPFEAGRYHSLIARLGEHAPLRVIARSEEGEIMALRHSHYPVYGVQFHPESVLTPQGSRLITNFLALASAFNALKTLQAA